MGSEMCIRDSRFPGVGIDPIRSTGVIQVRRQTFRVVPAGLARDVVVVKDVRVHGARDGGGGERDARAKSETDSGHHDAAMCG